MDLRVNIRDGSTLTFCLPDQLADWQALESNPKFQHTIRGMVLQHEGHLHALPVPSAFRRVRYTVSVKPNGNGLPAAARVSYVADDVEVALTLYLKGAPAMSRVDVKRVGRPVWIAKDGV